MQTIKTIGLDIAKSVFQVRGVGADGGVVVRRQLKRLDGAVFCGHRGVEHFLKIRYRPSLGFAASRCTHHWALTGSYRRL